MMRCLHLASKAGAVAAACDSIAPPFAALVEQTEEERGQGEFFVAGACSVAEDCTRCGPVPVFSLV